jgi:signal transduction histidine kinase
MRPGLRLQILLLLGGLMVLAFVPLHFAVATYTRYTLKRAQEDHALALGRAVASHVAEARARRSLEELTALAQAQVNSGTLVAIGAYDARGEPTLRSGAPHAVDALPAKLSAKTEELVELDASGMRLLAVVVPDARGAVVAALRLDDDAARAGPLLRLVALYTLVFALALLMLAYFALTRLIVRPLDRLARSAERVAQGARRLDVPIRGPRELAELAASFRTMTERLLGEEQALREKVDEVERATRRLTEAQDRLVRSERLASVGRLAAGLAHEIGNPISALIGFQDLLLAGGLEPAEEEDFLKRMRAETERIHRILRDLLQFARPAANTGTEGPVRGNVEVAIHDVTALVAPQKAMHGVEIALDVEPELPEVALSREHLVQVMLNLVLNAADACAGKGGVTLRARLVDAMVRVEVEDDGPGVAPELRERLFEPFVTSKEVGKGTGLGLAVCRGLVEASGGNVSLHSGFTSGARFVVELPKAV